MNGLTFRFFQSLNAERCRTAFHPDGGATEHWALAIAGEAGELCNLVKKIVRGDFPLEEVRQQVLEEAADVITYCDLLMTHLKADTGAEVEREFNIVSDRVGSSIKIGGLSAGLTDRSGITQTGS